MASRFNTEMELELVKKILRDSKTIAVVGISDNPSRPSYGVAKYLSRYYQIVPVNPKLGSWEGEAAYPDLRSVPSDVKIDLVNVFRRSDDVSPVIEEAVSRGVPYVWLQLGIVSEAAAQRAQEAGIGLIMDSCLAVEHAKYRGEF